jgi:hypothetical protein
MEAVEIKPMALKDVTIRVEGISLLVVHKMSSKARQYMRDLHQGKKEKVRGQRDPEQEYEDARYILSDGRDGVNVMAFKGAIIDAAHQDMGIAKTQVRKSIYLRSDGYDREDGTELIALDTPGPKMREDVVRLKRDATDLRYRPAFNEWTANLRLQYDSDWLRLDSLINLIERGGWRVGICENRPGKAGGDWGRFRVVREETN